MRYLSFLSVLCIHLSTTALPAATMYLDMSELFPQQNLIEAVEIEADELTAEITLNDGLIIDGLTCGEWPSLSGIAQISVKGPEVQFKVITQSGSEWTRSLGSFDLKLANVIRDARKELSLDLHATPLQKILDVKDAASEFNLGNALFKTLMLFADDDFHLYLLGSADLEENAHPSMKIQYELGHQSLAFEVHDKHDDLKIGAWKIRGNGFGKCSLIDLVLSAIRMASAECKKMVAETEYDQMLQQVFYGIDQFLELTAPIADWNGITLIVNGSFDYLSKETNVFCTNLYNHFQLETYDGSWNTSLETKTHISGGLEEFTVWSQEFILKNPTHDLEKAAAWIQQHWTDQLAIMLDMPSIKYYSDYFPKYFIQGLTAIMSSLGEIQEDGTVAFKISSNSFGSFTIDGFSPSELADLFIAKIKEKIGGWW